MSTPDDRPVEPPSGEAIEALFPGRMPDAVRDRLEGDLRDRLLASGAIARQRGAPRSREASGMGRLRVTPGWATALAASLLVAFVLGWGIGRAGRERPGPAGAGADPVRGMAISRLRGGVEGHAVPFRPTDIVKLRIDLDQPVLAHVLALTSARAVEPLGSSLREVEPDSGLLAFTLEDLPAGPLGLVLVSTTRFRSSREIEETASGIAARALDPAHPFEEDLATLVSELSTVEGLRAQAERIDLVATEDPPPG